MWMILPAARSSGLKPLGYEMINLGGHETITMNQLIHMLEDKIGRKAEVVHHPLNSADMLANWADTEQGAPDVGLAAPGQPGAGCCKPGSLVSSRTRLGQPNSN